MDPILQQFLASNSRTKALDPNGWSVEKTEAKALGAPVTLLHSDGFKAVVRQEANGSYKLTMLGVAEYKLPPMPAPQPGMGGFGGGFGGPMPGGLGGFGGSGSALQAGNVAAALQGLHNHAIAGSMPAAMGPPAHRPQPPTLPPGIGPDYYVTTLASDPMILIVAHRDDVESGENDENFAPQWVYDLLPSGECYNEGAVYELDQPPANPAALIADLVSQGLGWNEQWLYSIEGQDPASQALAQQIKQELSARGFTLQNGVYAPGAAPPPSASAASHSTPTHAAPSYGAAPEPVFPTGNHPPHTKAPQLPPAGQGPEFYVTMIPGNATMIGVAHRDDAARGLVSGYDEIDQSIYQLMPAGELYEDESTWVMAQPTSSPEEVIADLVAKGLGWNEDWMLMLCGQDPEAIALAQKIKDELAARGLSLSAAAAPTAAPISAQMSAQALPQQDIQPVFFVLSEGEVRFYPEAQAMGAGVTVLEDEWQSRLPEGWPTDEDGPMRWQFEEEEDLSRVTQLLLDMGLGWKEEYQQKFLPLSLKDLEQVRDGLRKADVEEGYVPREIKLEGNADFFVALDPSDWQLLYVTPRTLAQDGKMGDAFAPAYIRPFLPAGGPCDPGAWEMDEAVADAGSVVKQMVDKGLGWSEDYQRAMCPHVPSADLNAMIGQIRAALAPAPRKRPSP